MFITVCVIAYNEESTLPSLLEDICGQDYDHSKMEIVLVDSTSTDSTRTIMEQFEKEHSYIEIDCDNDNQGFGGIQVLSNPKKTLPCGWNVALAAYKGEAILKIDAHASIPKDFVSKNVVALVDNENIVGGQRPTIIDEPTPWKQTLLLAESSMFGSSIAPYRRSQEKNYVKSMFHAAYRRKVFDDVGTFNEKLARTEDNEIHYRMREAGYKLCFDPDIISYQHIRSSFSKMMKQKNANGYWIGLTTGECAKCLSIYHFIPFAFVVAIIMTTMLTICSAFGLLGFFGGIIVGLTSTMWIAYWVMAIIMALTAMITAPKGQRNITNLALPFLFFALHISYGIGTMKGMIVMPWLRNPVDKNIGGTMEETKRDKLQLLVRRFFLIVTDIILINGSVLLALMMRFNLEAIPQEYIEKFNEFVLPYTIITLVVFWCFRIYHSLWQYASITEIYKIVEAGVVAELLHLAFTVFLDLMLPRSCYFLAGVFLVCSISVSRFMYRFIRTAIQEYRHNSETVKIMIIGAGDATNVLIREIRNSRYLENSKVVCVIDDNPSKVGKFIHGIKIVGTRNQIKESARYYEVDEIIFAIPSATVEERKHILNICKETDCDLKILPGVYQMVDGEIDVKDIRKVDVLDLLGRETIEVDIESIMGYVSGKVVMVTGGGGSIGSELCRQLVLHKPKRLVIFDIYENNAYDIQQELKIEHPNVEVVTLIGSVRNTGRLDSIFEEYRPDIIYHAAAHKHVPLMEDSPNEAIKNNVIGTLNVARMADKYHAEKFVLISTDKAVNPTNVMGATKRMCEMIVQSFNGMSKTDYVAVRFGNVLGSNGSVIPLFKKQIEAGGPVTVTHPDIIRYFMTIPEAVSLVLQTGAYAKGGEIFILDMGEPVKIDDLAKNLIRLSGFTIGVDMEIKYTGLRPGEKLYEELLMKEEGLQDTKNKLIHIGKPIEFDKEHFFERLDALKNAAYDETEDIRPLIKEVVKTYKPYNILDE